MKIEHSYPGERLTRHPKSEAAPEKKKKKRKKKPAPPPPPRRAVAKAEAERTEPTRAWEDVGEGEGEGKGEGEAKSEGEAKVPYLQRFNAAAHAVRFARCATVVHADVLRKLLVSYW